MHPQGYLDLVPLPLPVRAAAAAAHEHAHRQAVSDRREALRDFIVSPELAGLEPRDRELIWVNELLDAMEAASWTWLDLDLETFEALLLDGFTWTIEHSPEDPGRVTRVLAAFLDFVERTRAAPHAAACTGYLRSPAATADIERWLHPQRQSPAAHRASSMAELSAPYNWCDGRCERCPLAARCPARSASLEPPASPADAGAEPASAAELRRQCHDFAFALLALQGALVTRGPDPSLCELSGQARLVAAKGVRIARHLSRSAGLDGSAALRDGVPNLLLLERVLAAIDRCLGAHHPLPPCAGAYLTARDRLHERLAPLLRSIPSRHRAELALRERAGLAPSPFLSPLARHADPL
jgi:hypothetical protein